MKKRILSALIAAVTAVSMLATTASASESAIFTAHTCFTDMQVKYVNDYSLNGSFNLDFLALGVRTTNEYTMSAEFEEAGGFVMDARSPATGIVAGGGTIDGEWKAGQFTFFHHIDDLDTVSISGASISRSVMCRICCVGFVRGEDSITVHDALEILKWLVGLDSVIAEGNRAWNAALITGGDSPTAHDAREILKWLVGLDSMIAPE
jgi:hypothetical protein